ncbi:hypothetical protein [Xanthovirga aplysinae]|uniref:hypothetical protein n=1 Tax=Xanthovirga aplysinae TaxID=2529853 RepID=UPI0012BD8012|nr:hypothetical protein [Xanthovirga aplysinae]MTI29698.1 hypothetical protein [Xanthovirga aplysinae]
MIDGIVFSRRWLGKKKGAILHHEYDEYDENEIRLTNNTPVMIDPRDTDHRGRVKVLVRDGDYVGLEGYVNLEHLKFPGHIPEKLKMKGGGGYSEMDDNAVTKDLHQHFKNRNRFSRAIKYKDQTAKGAAGDRAKGLTISGVILAADIVASSFGAVGVVGNTASAVVSTKAIYDAKKEGGGIKELGKQGFWTALGQAHPSVGFVRDASGLIKLGWDVAHGNFDKKQWKKHQKEISKVLDDINTAKFLLSQQDLPPELIAPHEIREIIDVLDGIERQINQIASEKSSLLNNTEDLWEEGDDFDHFRDDFEGPRTPRSPSGRCLLPHEMAHWV